MNVPAALAEVRDHFSAFTVDEYQDVNLLQQTLLDRWLGERDELCAVGDDYQSIYAFTGATPDYLLGLPARFPNTTVIRLEDNYRSSPEVLRAGEPDRPGARRRGEDSARHARLGAGADHDSRSRPAKAKSRSSSIACVRCTRMAFRSRRSPILSRTNARLADFEEPLHDAEDPVPGCVAARREARAPAATPAATGRTRRRLPPRCVATRRRRAGASGRRRSSASGRWFASRSRTPHSPGGGVRRRRSDDSRFIADLEARFGSTGADRRGVHLLTLHGAKGLEFEAVFIPRLEEKELPIRQAKKPGEIAEERRLFYVGLTRAKRHLSFTWSGKPSRFLGELGIAAARRRAREPSRTIRSTRH